MDGVGYGVMVDMVRSYRRIAAAHVRFVQVGVGAELTCRVVVVVIKRTVARTVIAIVQIERVRVGSLVTLVHTRRLLARVD